MLKALPAQQMGIGIQFFRFTSADSLESADVRIHHVSLQFGRQRKVALIIPSGLSLAAQEQARRELIDEEKLADAEIRVYIY